ncbi:MAG: ABC transporter ATP-binding protein [Ruminococcaceae bacterium]|nr:ABC transporter ATP-binding protein [Oscillospiraceae bacterium]
MIKDFARYYKPYKGLFIADMICAFLTSLCDLIYPMITRIMINDYIPNRMIKRLVIVGIVLLAVYIIKMALNYFIQYYGHLVGVGIQSSMRREIFAHMQKLPFSFFDNNKTGALMSRVVNDLMEIAELAHHGPEDLFLSIVLLIGAFIMMSMINIYLTLIIFALLPFLIAFAARKRLKMSEAFKKSREEISHVNANLENSISGIRVAKSFVSDKCEMEKFIENDKNFIKARKRSYKALAEFHSGNNFILDFMNVVVIIAGGIFLSLGKIDLGGLVAYLLYVNMFMNPIKRLIGFVEQFQDGLSGYRRFREIMEEEPEKDSENAVDIKNVKGDISFKNVTFAYDGGRVVLNNISFDVPCGKTVALVGGSGGGKTTVCHLVPRFYGIEKGRITLDGIDIKNITLESLRKNIGIVQQDVFLFTGSIYENIAYGKQDATKDEVISAAKLAKIDEFIESLPDKYDTYVGERGIKLSGGQKQRIAIARVFLKNPPVLILDEATSALDNITEAQIQQSLSELSEGRTVIVVAHRLSTVRNADNIIVLDRSGIVEEGNHTQLIEKGGAYAEMLHNISE